MGVIVSYLLHSFWPYRLFGAPGLLFAIFWCYCFYIFGVLVLTFGPRLDPRIRIVTFCFQFCTFNGFLQAHSILYVIKWKPQEYLTQTFLLGNIPFTATLLFIWHISVLIISRNYDFTFSTLICNMC